MPGQTPPPDISALVFGGLFVGCILILMLQSAVVLIGNMVKYRAQYLPVGVPLNELVVTSYWGVLRRAFKLEGISGLLRGIVPVSLGIIYDLIYLLPAGRFEFLLPKIPAFGTLLWIIFTPIGVLMKRSLTAPEPLPYFNISRMLDTLLTPEERAKPWLLYFLPGVIPVLLLHEAWDRLLFPRIRNAINPHVSHRRLRLGIFSVSSFKLLGVGFWLVHTVVSTPLKVLSIRLALLDVGAMTSSAAGEQVLSLRTGKPPYAGLWDCAVCIINEEGFETLFRGWGLSFLSTVWGGASVMSPKTTEKDEDKEQ